MRKSKRPRRTDAPKKYGEVKIIQQPASLIAGTDICIATGKQPVVILRRALFSDWTRCAFHSQRPGLSFLRIALLFHNRIPLTAPRKLDFGVVSSD